MVTPNINETPKPEFDLDSFQEKLGKNWDKFSETDKTAAVTAAKDTEGLEGALRNPVILRFFFETGGEEKWGKPDFSKLLKNN